MSSTIRPLSYQLEEVARRELNEDPKRRDDDLAHIKEWLKKQPHITTGTDDQWLSTFLLGCKFSLERTKEELHTYYTMRTMLPELYQRAYIKEWLKKQPHITAKTDDQWLLTFLQGCKFSLEITKIKLDTYYTKRTMLPEPYIH